MMSSSFPDSGLYVPAAFRASDPASLVRRHPFALLITTVEDALYATSTPLFFSSDDNSQVMVGHLARRNPQAQAMRAGQPALAVFSGPHAYVSAGWYESRPTVPTWNYVAAQVRGVLEPLDDIHSSLDVLRRSAQVLEQNNHPAWSLDDAPAGKVDSLLPAIRTFRLTISSIEGVTKLSQTQPPADRLRVIRHLLDRNDGDSKEIARLMAHLQPDE